MLMRLQGHAMLHNNQIDTCTAAVTFQSVRTSHLEARCGVGWGGCMPFLHITADLAGQRTSVHAQLLDHPVSAPCVKRLLGF